MNRTRNWNVAQKVAFTVIACVVAMCFVGTVAGEEPPVPEGWVMDPLIHVSQSTAISARDDAKSQFDAMNQFYDDYLYPAEEQPNYFYSVPMILERLTELRADVDADPGLKNDPHLTRPFGEPGHNAGLVTIAEFYRDLNWPAGTMDTNMDGKVDENDPANYGLKHAVTLYKEDAAAAAANLEAMEEHYNSPPETADKWSYVFEYAQRAKKFIDQAKDHRFILTQRKDQIESYTGQARGYINTEHNQPQYPQQ